jgi:hypothetical protein
MEDRPSCKQLSSLDWASYFSLRYFCNIYGYSYSNQAIDFYRKLYNKNPNFLQKECHNFEEEVEISMCFEDILQF